jgi:hypothetical protein
MHTIHLMNVLKQIDELLKEQGELATVAAELDGQGNGSLIKYHRDGLRLGILTAWRGYDLMEPALKATRDSLRDGK